MEKKRNKIIMAVLIILLALSLIVTLIFWLPDVSVEWAGLIYGNPVTYTIVDLFRGCQFPFFPGTPSLISIPISIANFIFAVKGLHSMYKEKTSAPKRIIGYSIYAIISLGALVIHCITFDCIFSSVLAG